jgi:hypothetical protein
VLLRFSDAVTLELGVIDAAVRTEPMSRDCPMGEPKARANPHERAAIPFDRPGPVRCTQRLRITPPASQRAITAEQRRGPMSRCSPLTASVNEMSVATASAGH